MMELGRGAFKPGSACTSAPHLNGASDANCKATRGALSSRGGEVARRLRRLHRRVHVSQHNNRHARPHGEATGDAVLGVGVQVAI